LIVINAVPRPRAYPETTRQRIASKRYRGKEEMGKRKSSKSSTGQGLCCPHCADSKFPCVNMEKSMRSDSGAVRPELKDKKE
jgi:hypothetical protein